MIDSTETATVPNNTNDKEKEREKIQLIARRWDAQLHAATGDKLYTYRNTIEPHKRSMTTRWRPLWIAQESIWLHGKTKSMAHALEIRWMCWKRHDEPLTLACAQNCPPFGTLNRRICFPFSEHCFINFARSLSHSRSFSLFPFLVIELFTFVLLTTRSSFQTEQIVKI